MRNYPESLLSISRQSKDTGDNTRTFTRGEYFISYRTKIQVRRLLTIQKSTQYIYWQQMSEKMMVEIHISVRSIGSAHT